MTAERLPVTACFHSGEFMERSLKKDGAGWEIIEGSSLEMNEAGLALVRLRRLALLRTAEDGLYDSGPGSGSTELAIL